MPTVLLLTPDEKFHSFGFAARDYYHDLDPQESKEWLYFDKFKMKLHNNMVFELSFICITTSCRNLLRRIFLQFLFFKLIFFYKNMLKISTCRVLLKEGNIESMIKLSS